MMFLHTNTHLKNTIRLVQKQLRFFTLKVMSFKTTVTFTPRRMLWFGYSLSLSPPKLMLKFLVPSVMALEVGLSGKCLGQRGGSLINGLVSCHQARWDSDWFSWEFLSSCRVGCNKARMCPPSGYAPLLLCFLL